MKRYLLLMSLFLFANVQAGELYRSIDKDGKVHYSDSPLMGTDDVEELKFAKEPKPDESLPYETQRAKQNYPVTLYVFPDCGQPCQQARNLLKKRGIPFTEKSLANQEEIDAFHKASNNGLIPSVTVGKNWLSGFLEDQWNAELDVAGYPKTAPYRPRPATPPPAQPAQ